MNSTAVWIILIPLAAAVLSFVFGRRAAPAIVLTASGALLISVGVLAWQVWHTGVRHHALGGWGAPLGIDLYADGLSAMMLLMTAIVGAAVSVYAMGYFGAQRTAGTHDRAMDGHPAAEYFWTLWAFLWAALNALFLTGDLFNAYVTLELLGISAVVLVTLAQNRAAFVAGMRYLLTSLLGSLFFLLGVALLYSAHGTLDMKLLAQIVTPTPATHIAIAVMTTGLLLKTALFPMHFWLPPAHSSAPAPVSALLSALVVKASFYLLLRLWFQVFGHALEPVVTILPGILGVAAILWGSLLALRQERLKLLVAYSTVAQIGYLFLLFPLVGKTAWGFTAWTGGIYHAFSHACAKAAMFMAAGCIMLGAGHDSIAQFTGLAKKLPVSVFAFALSGLTIMGMPPSGGFIAKWQLLSASLQSGQWWWAAVMIAGGLLAAGYVFRPLRQTIISDSGGGTFRAVPRSMELSALGLALLAIMLSFTAIPALQLLQKGSPF